VNRRITAACAVVLATLVSIGGSAAAAPSSFSFAFIGDAPYGTNAFGLFPSLVDDVNADPDVQFVAHSGDIKNGSSLCSDQLITDTFALYQRFEDPFWYTPGDNEWTDCHRTSNGGYLPTERLDFVRSVFFPNPSQTTGGTTMPVVSQASSPVAAEQPYVENTTFQRECVTFGALHVVGSNDDGSPWNEYPGGDQVALRTAEFTARRAATIAWVDKVFDDAIAASSEGVFLMMQAEPTTNANFAGVRNEILTRAAAFGKPVILAHGDAHVYTLTPNYGGVANLTRLENPGDTTAVDRWLKVSAACGSNSPSVFSVATKTFTPTLPPPAEVPEVPLNAMLPLSAAAVGGAWLVMRQRRLAARRAS
jgi:hypothetical protein